MGPDRVARLDRHQPAFTGHKPACGPLLVIFPFLSAAPPISLALEKKPCPFSSIASPRILPPPKPASWPGDRLVAVNGNLIHDVLDYRFYMIDTALTVEVERAGKPHFFHIKKDEYDELGLEFTDYLMDRQHHCANKCVFCFVDQLPRGMRETLYFKDDDSRMSFLFGSYVTLTNMTDEDIARIIKMHISPINISVHATNPELRVELMKNPRSGEVLKYIPQLAAHHIRINAQIVVCPGLNDGEELRRSLWDLGQYAPEVQSIALVPVGSPAIGRASIPCA